MSKFKIGDLVEFFEGYGTITDVFTKDAFNNPTLTYEINNDKECLPEEISKWTLKKE